MKAGIKSTEFWMTLIGTIAGMVMAVMGESQWTQIGGGLMAAIFGSSYTVGRSLVKGGQAKSSAAASVAEALAKKSPAD